MWVINSSALLHIVVTVHVSRGERAGTHDMTVHVNNRRELLVGLCQMTGRNPIIMADKGQCLELSRADNRLKFNIQQVQVACREVLREDGICFWDSVKSLPIDMNILMTI